MQKRLDISSRFWALDISQQITRYALSSGKENVKPDLTSAIIL